MSKKLLIKDGLVVCPDQNIEEKLDLLIENDKIVELKKEINEHDVETIDASGKIVAPGLVDMHCHLREPGREDVGTIQTGSESAAAGGFTSIACMANTNPPIDDKGGIVYILFKGKEAGLINVHPIGAVTKGLEGKELTEMAMLVEEGAVAVSDEDHAIMDASLMRNALQYTSMFNIPLIANCDDYSLSEDGCVNEGLVSTQLGFKGIPSISEEIMIARDIALTRFTQSKIHIAHVSTKESVNLIRKAKKDGIRITCEVTPHHFSLTENELLTSNYDTNTKIYPPLRSESDVEAILEALNDNTIDAIATDHNPWLDNEKDMEYFQAPYGVIGFETALPLVFTNLIQTQKLSLTKALAKLTVNPAQILNLSRGTLHKGKNADICIIDPELELNINHDFFHSISKNSPFLDHKLKGFAVLTMVDGQVVFDRNKNQFYKRN